jgi:pilus assembly protein Flp/PilA
LGLLDKHGPPDPKGTNNMTKALVKLQQLRSEKGATAVEYGLMVALIAIVIIVAVALLGDNLSTLFDTVANSV